MRKLIQKVLAAIDRDVARWSGNPLGTAVVACLPMIFWAVATGKKPIEASMVILVILLAPPVVLGSMGLWRGLLWLWSDHRKIQALGAAEELNRKRPR